MFSVASITQTINEQSASLAALKPKARITITSWPVSWSAAGKVAAAHCREELLRGLEICFSVHRLFPFQPGVGSNGREAAIDGQLQPIHEA